MGRIKRGAVGMPKRRKQAGINLSDGVTSAVSVQEAAEQPPVEARSSRTASSPDDRYLVQLCSKEAAAEKGGEEAGC